MASAVAGRKPSSVAVGPEDAVAPEVAMPADMYVPEKLGPLLIITVMKHLLAWSASIQHCAALR
jgi:hypothetical protein